MTDAEQDHVFIGAEKQKARKSAPFVPLRSGLWSVRFRRLFGRLVAGLAGHDLRRLAGLGRRRRLFDADQLDVEDQRRVRPDRTGAAEARIEDRKEI